MKIRKELKVGIVFILAATILIWGLMYLKGLELLKPSRTFYAVYSEVNGLVAANPVSIKGVKVGQVQQVSFHPTDPSKIVVELYVLGDYPIPKNSLARIFSPSLLGAPAVEIIPGNSKELALSGDTIYSLLEATIGQEVNRQLLPIKDKAEHLIDSMDSLALIFQEILNKDTRENLIRSVEYARISLAGISGTARNLDTLLASQRNNLSRTMANVESISSNLRRNNDKITNILTNFSALSDSLARARIPATLSRVNKAVTDLDSILVRINTGDGSLGQLLNNDQLYNEVEKAARDLNLLIEDIRKNPSRYVKVSVF